MLSYGKITHVNFFLIYLSTSRGRVKKIYVLSMKKFLKRALIKLLTLKILSYLKLIEEKMLIMFCTKLMEKIID